MALGMMDQMASIGVEFDRASLDRAFKQGVEYYQSVHTGREKKLGRKGPLDWALSPIYDNNKPVRPWGLGEIRKKSSLLYSLAGTTVRTPGLYKQIDPKTQRQNPRFLQDTNERIHSSVRIRLACRGLDLNDTAMWTCPSLDKWRLRRTTNKYEDPVPRHPGWEPEKPDSAAFIEHPSESPKGRWIWEYAGEDNEGHPNQKQRVMLEEPLGPYERYLLKLSGGSPNVYLFADEKGEYE